MNHFLRFYILLLAITIQNNTAHGAIKDTMHTAWKKVTSTLSNTLAQHTTQENTNCLHHIQQYKHLTVKIDQGSVAISAWDKPHTVVQYTIKGTKKAQHNTLCTEHKEGDSLAYTVTYRKKDEQSEKATIDFIIRVPFDCSLRCSLEEGPVKIKNLHASAIISANKGPIKIKNCNGSIKATAHKGSIAFKQYDLAANQEILLDASGNISIKVSPLAAATLSAHAPAGSITSDIVITLNQITMVLCDETWEERKHTICGTINNGSAQLVTKSHTGSITINGY